MAQDTRKDPRAKVLSMTVRYKSATIDEFIEHHSHDVSRGGIFIKTPSPFPPGTLLKFEIRIQDEQSVLAGVGRVVWKRETAQSGADQPAGMGVKFIKIDDKSKALIAKLVESQQGPSTFEAGRPEPSAPPPAGLPAAVASAPPAGTLAGVGPTTSAQVVAAAAAVTAGKAPAAAAVPAAKRASTMLGLGAIGGSGHEPPRPGHSGDAPHSAPPRPEPKAAASDGGFFPKTNPEAEMPPPEERTVMKQAAELLQQALAEAGGSMDEIGTPVAKDAAKEAPKPAETKPASPPVVESRGDAGKENGVGANGLGAAAAAGAPAAKPGEVKESRQAVPTVDERPRPKPEAKPESEKKVESVRPKPVERPAVAMQSLADRDKPEEGGSGRMLMILLIAAAIGGGVWLWMKQDQTTTPTAPTAAPTTAETAKPLETATAAPTPVPTEVPTAVPTATASAAATTTASAKATATATAVAAPPKTTPVTPPPKPPTTTPPAPKTTDTPPPKPPTAPPKPPPKKNDDPYG